MSILQECGVIYWRHSVAGLFLWERTPISATDRILWLKQLNMLLAARDLGVGTLWIGNTLYCILLVKGRSFFVAAMFPVSLNQLEIRAFGVNNRRLSYR